jgi:hypothetical protein
LINIEGKPVGAHPTVIRLLKGMFNLRPSFPKTNVTWDPEIVFKFLKRLAPAKELSLKNLTFKVVTLIWLLTGQRCQSLALMDIRNFTVTNHVVKIRFGDLLKQTRPGYQQKELTTKAYAPDRRLCIVTYLKAYLARTKVIRKRGGTSQLVISFHSPFRGVSKNTISRYLRTVMIESGLDMSIFTPHSIRGASTSAAARARVPMDTILSTGGWSRESTF